jgi:excinuclease ABC subunit B
VQERVQALTEQTNPFTSLLELEKSIKELRKKMQKAAKELDFIEAAAYRDRITALEAQKQQFS